MTEDRRRRGQGLGRRRLAIMLVAGAVGVVLVPRSANAQAGTTSGDGPSRAALLEAARQDRVSAVVPPTKSAIERGLDWYDTQTFLSKTTSGWNGIHLAGGGFPAGAGLNVGVGFTRFAMGSRYTDADLPNRIDLDAVAAYSTRGYARVRGTLGWLNIGGLPLDVRAVGQYYEFPQEDFFGLGRHSRESDRTSYHLNSSEFGLDIAVRPVRGLGLLAGASWLTPEVGSGTDDRFSAIDARFDPASLPGFLGQPDFLKISSGVEYAALDNPRLPRAGGLARVVLSNYHDQDAGRFDFRRLDVDVRGYVPLPNRARNLALRATAMFTDTPAGQAVPFYYLPTLGGAEQLRGFREFRFRDNQALLLSAEYRWSAWWAMTPAFFVDAGTVAARRGDLRLRDMDVAYGVGFRIHSNNAFLARLDLAFSREGFIPLLRFEHAF